MHSPFGTRLLFPGTGSVEGKSRRQTTGREGLKDYFLRVPAELFRGQTDRASPLGRRIAMRTAQLSSHLDPGTYQPRAAEKGVLYAIIRDNLETFLREAAHRAEGARLPDFVEQEFRGFLTCGVLAHGFARVRCGTCAFERLVPFSCKGRGFCPSCGGRRMTERAAHLVDEVLPRSLCVSGS